VNTGSAEPWTPPPSPPPQPPQPQCLTWPQYPLHCLSTPARLIDADRCTPGGLVQIETFSTRGGRWTETYYAPAAADLAVLDRLEPGCPPDRVPWERFRAELIVAPAALLRQRDWRRVPAASLLMLMERLRRRLAADEAASRGIAEPEAPRAMPDSAPQKRNPTERSEERKLARRLLEEAWNQSDNGTKPFPGYDALIQTAKVRHGVDVTKSHLSNARRYDLGELTEQVGRWVNPPRLSPVRADEPEPTPAQIEDCQQWFATKAAEAKSGRVLNALPDSTAEFWKHMAARSPEDWQAAFVQFTKEAQTGIR
jgi:hypothetical protein